MGVLFTSPLSVHGELHGVKLFNFSLDPNEIVHLIPKPLIPVIHKDRAWVSMVSVYLKKMRPSFFPESLGAAYHHIAFRVLVDCPARDGLQRGIYFLESFCNRPWFVRMGNLFTDYAFSHATIEENHGVGGQVLNVDTGRHKVSAFWSSAPGEVSPNGVFERVEEVMDLVGPLVRAFSVNAKGGVDSVAISRERWPLKPIHCTQFKVDRFKSAHFELALQVQHPINYIWSKGHRVSLAEGVAA